MGKVNGKKRSSLRHYLFFITKVFVVLIGILGDFLFVDLKLINFSAFIPQLYVGIFPVTVLIMMYRKKNYGGMKNGV